ncbi:MAG: PqiC family protein [Opitutaceae bacterium]
MKPRLFSILALGCSALGLLLVSGCNVIPPVQPDATRYYVLSGPAFGETAAQSAAGTLRLGLRPVEVAPYLRRGSMVVRAGENEISFAETARWGEPLDREINSSLRQRLSATPSVARVFTPPFPVEPTRDFDISIQVIRCEGVRESATRASARFAATIEISTTGENAQVVARRTFVAPDATWDGKDFSRLAALLSDAVAALSQDVVAALPEKK